MTESNPKEEVRSLLLALAKVAKSAPRVSLVRFPRIVRETARDLEHVEPPRRGSDLLRVLVRAPEREAGAGG
jgi:hypothetical protein